jgi:CRISPR-associated protein Csd1
MDALIKTYDSSASRIDEFLEKSPMDRPPLLPLCLTVENADIKITLDRNGNFIGAELLSKEDSPTIVPCTESSSERTSGFCPHPLHDELQYVAKDYAQYAKEKEAESKKNRHDCYLCLISEWCESKYVHPRVETVKKYIERGAVVSDLIKSKILILDSSNELAAVKGERADTTMSKITNPKKAFIRWEIFDDDPQELKKDKAVWRLWKDFYLATLERDPKRHGLCYITGKETILSDIHPSGVRYSGDRTKIISSNDNKDFTYRGRFEEEKQVCGVGFEETQKAHCALRWLIGLQGYSKDGLAIVSWTIANEPIHRVTSDVRSINGKAFMDGYTGKFDAESFRNMLMGYCKNSDPYNPKNNVIVMALNSVSDEGKGRLSILFYRELMGSVYLKRIADWNDKLCWVHRWCEGEDEKKRRFSFVGAPAPKEIAYAALGEKADSKLISHTIERLLPCIIDGIPVPQDIVDLSVRNASAPLTMDDWKWNNNWDWNRSWKWEKILSISCSLYKGTKKEKYGMTLDESNRNRDYLYGRLLAVADMIESESLKEAKEKRQTAAIRYMQRFRDYPCSTWTDIHSSLPHHIASLENRGSYYVRILSQITDLFERSDFMNNEQLSGEYLLGFYSQREKFYEKKTDTEEET